MGKKSGNSSKLKKPGSGGAAGGLSHGAIDRWLGSHKAATKFIDDWLTLRARGESDWNARDVMEELVTNHGMPRCSLSGFRDWIRRQRGGLETKEKA